MMTAKGFSFFLCGFLFLGLFSSGLGAAWQQQHCCCQTQTISRLGTPAEEGAAAQRGGSCRRLS